MSEQDRTTASYITTSDKRLMETPVRPSMAGALEGALQDRVPTPPQRVLPGKTVRAPQTAEGSPRVVRDAGLTFLTRDPFLLAAVKKCAQLERENAALRCEMVARYRTLRRDVSQIKRKVCNVT